MKTETNTQNKNIPICNKCLGDGGWMVHGYGTMPNWVICNKCHGTGNMNKKKYSILEDFMDTFFHFQNADFTPVKVIIVVAWLILLGIAIYAK